MKRRRTHQGAYLHHISIDRSTSNVHVCPATSSMSNSTTHVAPGTCDPERVLKDDADTDEHQPHDRAGNTKDDHDAKHTTTDSLQRASNQRLRKQDLCDGNRLDAYAHGLT